MAYSDKKQKGEIRDIPQEARKMYGAEGGLGLIAGTIGRIGKAFANTAKQYMRGGKVAKPTSNFKPFHRDGKVYSRKDINDAFKRRFKPEAQQTIRPPKSTGTNFGRPDATVSMRNAMKKSRQYPKSDPFRGSPDLR